MASRRSCSVIALLSSTLFDLEAGAVVKGFALTGGLPDTYRAARPLPGADAGKRRARTVESLGIISVSSVYSEYKVNTILRSRGWNQQTFITVFFVYL